MDHIAQNDSVVGAQGWDALVTQAIASSGVEGTAILDGGTRMRPVPHGLSALMSALLHFLAPELPRRMRLYTYDLSGVGAMLEVRGARELTGLPQQLVDLGKRFGVRLTFHKQGQASSVLLTLPATED